MKADSVIADGPYRYVRNPLYLGLWCTIAALTFVMPPTGALVTMILLQFFNAPHPWRRGVSIAPAWRDLSPLFECRASPDPATQYERAKGSAQPHWQRAVLTELNPIGVFVALAVFSWSYDNRMMVKVILIGFGVSLVMRAFVPGNTSSPD